MLLFQIHSVKMGKLGKKRKKDWRQIEIPIVIPTDEDPGTETMEYQESYRYIFLGSMQNISLSI